MWRRDSAKTNLHGALTKISQEQNDPCDYSALIKTMSTDCLQVATLLTDQIAEGCEGGWGRG